jgi:ribosome-associated heat shock protein Hsp15
MEEGQQFLRLDKYLYFARFAKSRSLAVALIEQGHPRIDGVPIDRHHIKVRPGNIITIIIAGHIRVFRIELLPSRRGPACEAQTTYCELSPPQSIDERRSRF